MAAETPIRSGDTWACVTAKGRGQPVKIKKVTKLNVQFRAFGRGADDSRAFSLPIDLFRTRYVPLSQIDTRQKQLVREERAGVTPVLVDAVADVQASVSPEPIMVTEPTVLVSPMKRPVGRGRGGQLTGEQAREIFELMKNAPTDTDRGVFRREVGATYSVLPQTVYDIERGKSYSWATGQQFGPSPRTLRKQQASQPLAATVVMRDPPKHEEPPVVEPTRIPSPQPAARPPASLPEQRLLTDMADALDFLLEYAGRPLPKFMMIDLGSIQKLSDRARALGAS